MQYDLAYSSRGEYHRVSDFIHAAGGAMGTIQENFAALLSVLAKQPRNDGQRGVMDGVQLASATNLDAEDVNDAISLLVRRGLAQWRQESGSAPFAFSGVWATPEGRLAQERSETAHAPLQQSRDLDVPVKGTENLTPRQRELLSGLVRAFQENSEAEFVFAPTMDATDQVQLRPSGGTLRGTDFDLRALQAEDFVTLRRTGGNTFGAVRQRAVDLFTARSTPTPSPQMAVTSPPGRRGRWQALESLGQGGQGEVFLALDVDRADLATAAATVHQSIETLTRGYIETRQQVVETLARALSSFYAQRQPANLGALKVLHSPKHTAGLEKARQRMEGEVRTYESVTHPNLLRILDKNLPEDWFVTEYHPLGPLTKHLGRCAGDPLAALRAFRPLVEATAVLHEQRMIHRDIKPANIFVTVDGSLVLGDAGIVFFSDDERSRVSDTLENVGSRDWMPQWAMGMRLEDVKPTFDVFCLGKVLWAMVSGRPLLRLWYHRRPEFDLEKFFPGDDRMPWINALLAQCVVEHEEDMTISSAGALLKVVDEILVALGRDGRLLRKAGPGHCGMCGVGLYGLLVDRARLDSAISNMGLNPGAGTWRIFRCNRCGHLQFFLEHSTLIGINKADVWGT